MGTFLENVSTSFEVHTPNRWPIPSTFIQTIKIYSDAKCGCDISEIDNNSLIYMFFVLFPCCKGGAGHFSHRCKFKAVHTRLYFQTCSTKNLIKTNELGQQQTNMCNNLQVQNSVQNITLCTIKF